VEGQPNRRAVTITHAGTGDLVDFALPLTVPDQGVQFVDLQGRPLAHELEAATPPIAWVRLPRIAPGTTSPAFWMYYGAPSARTPAQVFPAPYAGVWHFAGDARDATAHHQDGSDVSAQFADGQLGSAVSLDTTARDHIALSKSSSLVSGAAGVTVSFWAQHHGPVHDGQDIVIGIGTADTSGHLSRVSVAISPELGLIGEANPDEGAWDVTSSAPGTVPDAGWAYLTVVIDVAAHTIQLYKDGQALGSRFRGNWTAAAYRQPPSDRITIGCEEDQSKSFFNGLIDELRVETTARNADWIAAQYRAQGGKMTSVGDEESR
jgi:hypothetical protein